MTNKIKIIPAYLSIFFFFVLSSGTVFAASFGNSSLYCFSSSSRPTFCSAVSFFIEVIGSVVPIIVSISLAVFLWGIFRYVMYDGEDRQKSRDVMIYGIIGLFVMVSVWGLVNILKNTVEFDNTDSFYYYNSNYGNYGGYGNYNRSGY